MTERVNLVDAYDNRSVVAKLVNMEERISGAETSVEASAEAAATSASKAAVSQTAAKTSEANAKASADAAAATLSNTVDLSSKQTITGAKTFAGDTTVTGQLISSGTNTLSGTTELEGTVELDSTAVATLNGKVTASNTGNSIKVANHDTALISNDVLSAKDINTPNGDANNLLHRSGDEPCIGAKEFVGNVQFDAKCQLNSSNPYLRICDTGLPAKGSSVSSSRISKILFQASDNSTLVEHQFRTYTSGTTNETIQVINQTHTYYANFAIEVNAAGKATLTLDLYNSSGTKLKSATIATLEA